MPRFLLVLLVLVTWPRSAEAVGPGDILPRDAKYDPAIPTPRKALGFDIGSRHLHHHQLIDYLRTLARSSPRISHQTYGTTFGGRPLLLLSITSAENHKKLDEIRKHHLALADPEKAKSVPTASLPAVVWMGYNVHGNEPSAGNAAALVAYHLAAGTGESHEKLLRETVILLEPCLNPDGFERFAQWVNSNRGAVTNDDPEHREHREPWPNGRTNFYWFDLNRDWLPAQMPESRGRLGLYHQWKPEVVLDFHEMGTNATYYFQPGSARRVHPLIPARNQELTRLLARHHARALDRVGSLYYTEETFDDYYPGKGSTYADLHGGVGILFEQASSRGQAQESPHGRLTFPFTIRNQFLTSLSSLAGAQELRTQLHEFKRRSYLDAWESARRSESKGWLVSAPGDPGRLRAFLDVLHAHDIRAYHHKGVSETAVEGESWYVPLAQPEARFLQTLFETRTTFAENIFYDVSAWTLPLAFNIEQQVVEAPLKDLAEPYQPGPAPAHKVTFTKDDLAYLIDWRHGEAPRAVYQLLAAEVKVRVASAEMKVAVEGRSRTLGHGTIIVPLGIQPARRAAVVAVLEKAAREGVPVYALPSGLTDAAPNLGSPRLLPVPQPRVLLVTGEGVTAYDAGEVWHFCDRRLGLPVTLVDAHRLGSVNLERYTAIVLPNGTYAGLTTETADKLRSYASKGGTLVAVGTAISWLASRKIATVLLKTRPPSVSKPRPYDQAEDDAAQRLIRGAIFRTRTDGTHPVCYGLPKDQSLPVCRTTTVMLEPSDDAYNTPVRYEEKPLVSGYVSAANLERLSESAGVVVAPIGSGRAILLTDNPVYRGYWRGTERLLVNALFFGPLLRVPEAKRP
jgi:hypothetical protein